MVRHGVMGRYRQWAVCGDSAGWLVKGCAMHWAPTAHPRPAGHAHLKQSSASRASSSSTPCQEAQVADCKDRIGRRGQSQAQPQANNV